MSPSSFLVAGGTGRQGGAVINALLNEISPQSIFAITRDANGNSAKRLTERKVNLIVANLNSPEAIFQQLIDKGVSLNQLGVFLAQAHGPTEVTDAKALIDAAAKRKVAYFVYSSVDRGGKELSDRDASYCKTFYDKFEIERYLQSQSHSYTILRPVWFADNADWGFPGRMCMTGWRDVMGGKRLQVITTKDIGRWAVEALLRPGDMQNTAVSIASDELTFDELDQVFFEETGRHVATMNSILARMMIWAIRDVNTMFGWINGRDYGADLLGLSKRLQPTTFRMYVKESVK